MRGKVNSLVDDILMPGITPAYAGKSCTGCSSSGCFRDHPRLCGEKAFDFTVYFRK